MEKSGVITVFVFINKLKVSQICRRIVHRVKAVAEIFNNLSQHMDEKVNVVVSGR